MALTLITGCSGQTPPSTHGEDVFAEQVARAEASGVDATQIEILKRSSAQGQVRFEDLSEAVQNTYACLDEHGIRHTETVKDEPWGSRSLHYEMRVPSDTNVDASVALADECTERFSGMIEALYASQPTEVALKDAWRESVVKPAIGTCLDDAGIAHDADATFDELNDLALQAAGGEAGDKRLLACVMDISESGF